MAVALDFARLLLCETAKRGVDGAEQEGNNFFADMPSVHGTDETQPMVADTSATDHQPHEHEALLQPCEQCGGCAITG